MATGSDFNWQPCVMEWLMEGKSVKTSDKRVDRRVAQLGYEFAAWLTALSNWFRTNRPDVDPEPGAAPPFLYAGAVGQ
jgi:hypothetical protein